MSKKDKDELQKDVNLDQVKTGEIKADQHSDEDCELNDDSLDMVSGGLKMLFEN